MDLGIRGKKALITGGGRGIGKAIARTLAQEGVDICVTSRTESELKQVCEDIVASGGNARYCVYDLSDHHGLKGFKNAVGTVDILIHNAARVYRPQKLTRMNEEDWYQTLDVDLNAVYRLTRLFLDDMQTRKWGRIMTIGSLSGVVGVSAYPAYCAAKSALEGLTKNLAVDYSRYGITVNQISPGFVQTERFQKAAPPALLEKFANATAVKRLACPEDVANAVAYLASQQAAYITGINLLVCGGLNLGNLW